MCCDLNVKICSGLVIVLKYNCGCLLIYFWLVGISMANYSFHFFFYNLFGEVVIGELLTNNIYWVFFFRDLTRVFEQTKQIAVKA